MATLTYVGRAPDSDSTITPKSYADSQESTLAVTTSIVNGIIAAGAVPLTNQAYVDNQDALRAHKTDVTAADATFVALSSLGTANGVASLDSFGNLVATQIPSVGLQTDRIIQYYSVSNTGTAPILGGSASSVPGAVGNIILTPGSSHTVGTTLVREFQLASLVIPDPGYLWRPLAFAWVQGNSSGGTAPSGRQVGNGNYGLLSIMPPSGVSNVIYSLGICTGSIATDTYVVLPSAIANTTPLTQPAISGGLELDLFGCCFSGNTYTYLGTNLTMFVLVVPSL